MNPAWGIDWGRFIDAGNSLDQLLQELNTPDGRETFRQGLFYRSCAAFYRSPEQRYGVATARRAWLEPRHVANTRPWKELQKLRKRAR